MNEKYIVWCTGILIKKYLKISQIVIQKSIDLLI